MMTMKTYDETIESIFAKGDAIMEALRMRRFDLPEYKGKPCPMCKKHEAITIKRKATTIRNEVMVEYDEFVFFCSFLGKDDPDAYFVPPKVMMQNQLSAMKAYEKKVGMLSHKDESYIAKLEEALDRRNKIGG